MGIKSNKHTIGGKEFIFLKKVTAEEAAKRAPEVLAKREAEKAAKAAAAAPAKPEPMKHSIPDKVVNDALDVAKGEYNLFITEIFYSNWNDTKGNLNASKIEEIFPSKDLTRLDTSNRSSPKTVFNRSDFADKFGEKYRKSGDDIDSEKVEKAKTMDRTKYYKKIDTIFRKMIKLSKTEKNGNKEARDAMDSLVGDIGAQESDLIRDQGFSWFAGNTKAGYSLAGDRLNQQNRKDVREHLNNKFSKDVVDDVYDWVHKPYWA